MAGDDQKSGYIMVVEDDKLLLEAILDKLKKEGFSAKGFIHGTEAMKCLIDKKERPELIWLDYYLGDTNGLSFVKILKSNPTLKKTPVFVVSNSAGGDKVKHLLDNGADEYFVKANYTLKQIIEKINSRLKK